MNRIILIGNGFDLAHEFKTRYSDFVDEYWNRVYSKLETNIYEIFNHGPRKYTDVTVYEDDLIKITLDPLNMVTPSKEFKFTNTSVFFEYADKLNLKFLPKNRLLYNISRKFSKNNNWVDIENEYFENLKRICNSKVTSINPIVSKLNLEFKDITNMLEAYLHKLFLSGSFTRYSSINESINEIIKFEYLNKAGKDSIIEETIDKLKKKYQGKMDVIIDEIPDDERDAYELLKSAYVAGYGFSDPKLRNLISNDFNFNNKIRYKPNQILLLNFNYTLTAQLYKTDTNFELINIHGQINDSNNPIVFGYGDEIGNDYLELENLKNNDLLENIKSIKYLNNDNYSRLMQFVESDNYEIMIMGHSCGSSDRTLLNAIFEHDNCCSIKVYYHQFYNEKEPFTDTVINDNFSEIIKNISRQFKNKTVMRDRVVNKSLCSPLILTLV